MDVQVTLFEGPNAMGLALKELKKHPRGQLHWFGYRVWGVIGDSDPEDDASGTGVTAARMARYGPSGAGASPATHINLKEGA